MSNIKTHYETLLADVYTWAFGGNELNQENNATLFKEIGLTPSGGDIAIDLGAGSGFQSIPLLKLGYQVVAVDLCEKLLSELKEQWHGPELKTISGDLRNAELYNDVTPALILCMGDTLSHFETLNDIENLIANAHTALEKGGKFILSYRDLSLELTGTDRFIPVKSDRDRIFTCFLEYGKETVTVNDVLYERNGEEWDLHKSAYTKIKIPKAWLLETLETQGFKIIHEKEIRGMHTLVAHS